MAGWTVKDWRSRGESAFFHTEIYALSGLTLNCIMERLVRSIRTEALDRMLIRAGETIIGYTSTQIPYYLKRVEQNEYFYG
jgi:hypothetical protein